MKQAFKILIFLMLLFLCTAEDCSNNTRDTSVEDQQLAMFQEIENNFEKEQLEPEELKAFENRSLQMLHDLVDYLNIYSDTELSKEFRLQSKQMLSELFISQNEFDSFFTKFQLVEDRNNMILYFEGGNPEKLQLASASVSKKLTNQTNLKYSGSIEFILSSSHSGFSLKKNQIEILLKKSQKQFGEKTEEVWEVLFGKINK